MAYAVWHICEVGKRSCSVFSMSGNAESRVEAQRAALHKWQSAASHKSVVHWQLRVARASGNRASLAHHLSRTNWTHSSSHEGAPNSLKFVRGETYLILVSEPVTASIAATAFAPTLPIPLYTKLSDVSMVSLSLWMASQIAPTPSSPTSLL